MEMLVLVLMAVGVVSDVSSGNGGGQMETPKALKASLDEKL